MRLHPMTVAAFGRAELHLMPTSRREFLPALSTDHRVPHPTAVSELFHRQAIVPQSKTRCQRFSTLR